MGGVLCSKASELSFLAAELEQLSLLQHKKVLMKTNLTRTRTW